MKVLILSCDTGEGHNSAGRALSDYFTRRGVECEMLNALRFYPRALAALISKGHVFIYRKLPLLFGAGYRMEEKHTSQLMIKGIEKAAGALTRYILEGGYDAALCVHAFPALMLTFIQHSDPLPIRTLFVATDYTASPSCDRIRPDVCVIPDASLTDDFAAAGIRRETIAPCGIPVRAALYQKLPSAEAKKRVGIDPSHRHLLIMTGSMGCGPMEELTQLLANLLPASYDVSVACSNNEQLIRRMQRAFRKNPNIHICGYIDNISAMMDSADLFLTKPGGISTTEAMVKGLPMVLVNVVGGCETPNLQFFVSHGGAATAQTPEQIAELCRQLLYDDARRGAMHDALVRMQGKPAAAAICDCLE